MTEIEWRKLLSGLPVDLRYFETIGSTNDEALAWAGKNATEYSLVVAEHQSAGRGRMQRAWVTHAGTALAFSLILRPNAAEASKVTLFSPLAAMALCDALAKYSVLNGSNACQIKWPNDVLVNGKKAAGILVESTWMGEQVQSVVIGMGVNVKVGSVPQEGKLLFPATSLEEQINAPLDRITLLHDILERIIALRTILMEDRFIEHYNQLLAFKGQKVVVQQPNRDALCGTVAGVLANGDLQLVNEQGKEITASVGDVHLRPA